MLVRAIHGVATTNVTSPGFESMNTKLYYPSLGPNISAPAGTPFPANATGGPFPVVIFMNGADCSLEVYQWLAIRLVLQGLMVLTCNWVQSFPPDTTLISPGLNPAGFSPSNYNTVPLSSSLPPLFDALDKYNSRGVLKGLIDTNTIVVGGHSLGGFVALNSGINSFFPRVKGVFTYGAHAGSSPGVPPGSYAPLPSKLPYLLIGGNCDGVIASAGASRGLNWSDPTVPVQGTWQNSLPGGYQNQYLLLFQGANHFVIADPQDNTTSSGYLDYSPTSPPGAIRSKLVRAVRLFILGEVRNVSSAKRKLDRWISKPPSFTLKFSRK